MTSATARRTDEQIQQDVVVDAIEVPTLTDAARTDTDIADAARWALKWDAVVPIDRIELFVSEGVVTLTGRVDREYQRADAERAVSRLTGVQGVINRLTVLAPVSQVVAPSTVVPPTTHPAPMAADAAEEHDLKLILLILVVWGCIFGAVLIGTALSASSAF